MSLSVMDNMEGIGAEEHVAVGSCNNNNDATHVIKRKRTKRRLKPLSPCGVATTVTSSCSSASGGGGGSFSSTTFEGTDQEEEDMANCLILLAQGKGGEANPHHHHHHHRQHKQPTENHVDGNNKMTERATKSGFYIYECKTCNRTFPSFQALGGHRASHKKPKTQQEKKPSPPPLITSIGHDQFEEADYKQNQMKNINIISSSPPPPISLQLGYCGVVKPPNKPNKIHECSICGSEFTSGQALGGHMRRHRASTNNNHVADVDVKSRNVLELDLNLPAPEDDLRDSTFQFPATQKSVVLSAAPALVGCHY